MCPAPIIANPQTDFNESPALAAGGFSAPSVARGDRLGIRGISGSTRENGALERRYITAEKRDQEIPEKLDDAALRETGDIRGDASARSTLDLWAGLDAVSAVLAGVMKRNKRADAKRPEISYATCRCSRATLGHSVDQVAPVYEDAETGKQSIGESSFADVVTCGSVWLCPVCGRRIADERRIELEFVMKQAVKDSDRDFVFGTYTIQHRLSDRLADLLRDLKDSVHKAWAGRGGQAARDAVGYKLIARVVEIRWSPETGWHPHFHEVATVNRGVTPVALDAAIGGRYGAQLEARGYHYHPEHSVLFSGVNDQTSLYLTKFAYELSAGAEKTSRGESISFFQLAKLAADTGEQRYRDLVVEYAEATSGVRWFVWGRHDGNTSIFNALLETTGKTAEDVADEARERVPVAQAIGARYTEDEFGELAGRGLRGSARVIMDRYGARGLRDWLVDMGVWNAERDRAWILARMGHSLDERDQTVASILIERYRLDDKLTVAMSGNVARIVRSDIDEGVQDRDWLAGMVGRGLNDRDEGRARHLIDAHDLADVYRVSRVDWGWAGTVAGPLVLERLPESPSVDDVRGQQLVLTLGPTCDDNADSLRTASGGDHV